MASDPPIQSESGEAHDALHPRDPDAPPPALPPVFLGHLDVPDAHPAEETPRPLPQPYRRPVTPLHHEMGSRELMLGWCFWLLGSWFALGMGLSGRPIRWMIFAALAGLMVGWPAFRLSQDGNAREFGHDDAPDAHRHRPRRNRLTPGLIFRDWVGLNGVLQAVIWPHLITGLWSPAQALWISAAVAAWSLLAGAIVAWGCASARGSIRFAAMYLVLALLLAEPAILASVSALAEQLWHTRIHWTMHVSPIEAVYALTSPQVDFDAGPWIVTIGCVVLAGAIAWLMVLRRPKPALVGG